MSYIGKVVTTLIDNDDIKRVTKYFSPHLTIKATRQGRRDKRSKRMTVLVSIGRPNYAERKFIDACKKAGEPFPVKKLQIKSFPRRKGK